MFSFYAGFFFAGHFPSFFPSILTAEISSIYHLRELMNIGTLYQLSGGSSAKKTLSVWKKWYRSIPNKKKTLLNEANLIYPCELDILLNLWCVTDQMQS